MTKISFFLAALIVIAIAGSGCVPFWVHHDAVKKNENYLKIIEGHQAEHADLARRAEQAETKAASLAVQNLTLEQQRKLAEELAKKLHEQIKDGLTTAVKQVDLGSELGSGEVKITKDNKISIAGDVLFSLGSADLTAKAKSILKKLAPVLQSQVQKYFIRIEGHTDDQPIKRETTKKKFPTNWHLSMGRAVSVLEELKSLGIPETKMYAAGYGEFMPRVANNAGKKGHPENRRVEIAIVESK